MILPASNPLINVILILPHYNPSRMHVYSIPGSHLGRGLGDVGLVLVIDHACGPVLGNEGADVGPGVFDARLRVAQQIILYRVDN